MSDTRPLILEKLLPLVPFDGWTDYALRQAAVQAGIDEAGLKRAFPGGAHDCLDYFFADADDVLAQTLSEQSLATCRVPERIEKLVLARLEYFQIYREAVRRALAQRALPWNAPRALQSLYRSVDCMWRLAGDTSTDFNFYTKRATLAAIYTSTVLFWLNDASPHFEDSASFLKRRLQNVADFGKWKHSRRKAG